MIVYHRTFMAERILAEGFWDAEGTYLTFETHIGVWVADSPLNENEGVGGDRVLTIDIPESVIGNYEWIEEGKPCREWLVPAELLNRFQVGEVDDL